MVSPRHTLVSFPASAAGTGIIVIVVSIEAEGQPQSLTAFTETVPAPTLGQFTFTDVEPCPETRLPFVIVQLKVNPEMVSTV